LVRSIAVHTGSPGTTGYLSLSPICQNHSFIVRLLGETEGLTDKALHYQIRIQTGIPRPLGGDPPSHPTSRTLLLHVLMQ
jgi:hypothetical protein